MDFCTHIPYSYLGLFGCPQGSHDCCGVVVVAKYMRSLPEGMSPYATHPRSCIPLWAYNMPHTYAPTCKLQRQCHVLVDSRHHNNVDVRPYMDFIKTVLQPLCNAHSVSLESPSCNTYICANTLLPMRADMVAVTHTFTGWPEGCITYIHLSLYTPRRVQLLIHWCLSYVPSRSYRS